MLFLRKDEAMVEKKTTNNPDKKKKTKTKTHTHKNTLKTPTPKWWPLFLNLAG